MKFDHTRRSPRLDWLWTLAPFVLFGAYAVFASALAVRQYDSFHTHAFDMAYLDNVVWNTSQGRLFVNDLPGKPGIFLADHFSPALILMAPLYWLRSDARILLIVQVLALALSAVPCYLLVRKKHPRLAVLVMFALYLNPALLGIALSEFHEIALAAPLLAFALWAMVTETRDGRPGPDRARQFPPFVRLVFWACLIGALLVKEELAIAVAAIGIYVCVARPADRVAGVTIVALALGWMALAWGVVQNLMADAVSHWQDRYGDIAATPAQGLLRLLSDPLFLVSRYASVAKISAVARVLLPLGFLPLLAPNLFALAVPIFAYLLLSDKQSVSQLQFWYVTPLLPVLFVAAAAAIAAAPRVLARAMCTGLVVLSALAYWAWSVGPYSLAYEPARFDVNARTKCAAGVLALVPPSASISAQDNLSPHLAHRRSLNVFPALGEPPAEYVVLDGRLDLSDGHNNWTPYRPGEVPAALNQFLARPEYTLVADACDYKLLRHTPSPVIPHPTGQTFGQTIRLVGYELAEAGDDGAYQTVERAWGAHPLRITLWWEADAPLDRDYTVFVHALDPKAALVGQHDSPPANGFMPTSQWSPGEVVKDIHYLSADAAVTQVEVGLYEAGSGARLPLEDGTDAFRLAP